MDQNLSIAVGSEGPTEDLQGGSCRAKAKKAKISVYVHCFAGLLLLLFALSHFSMLTVPDVTQRLRNLVFPFTTNWTVYLLAGVFELAVAIVCLWKSGSDSAYAAISVFLAIILWYRWALSTTAGHVKTCQCLGILGRALSLSPATERIAPIIVLALLGLIVFPWFVGRLVDRIRHLATRKTAAFGSLLILMGAYKADLSYAVGTLEVSGRYDYYHCNAFTGEPFTNECVTALFTFTLSGNTWGIYATNLAQVYPWQKPWVGVVYDGADTYILLPDVKDQQGKLYSIEASISSGPTFLPDFLVNGLDLDLLYITYGLRPATVSVGKHGVAEIPLPWYSRANPWAFGAEWRITPSEDGRFVSQCKVVANTNLDLGAKSEALRPTFIYPYNLETWNTFVEKLTQRRDQFPQGFVQCVYRCKEWRRVGGFTVPVSSEEMRYLSRYYPAGIPCARAIVTASKVTIHPAAERVLPERLPCETLVIDYRYRSLDKVHLLPFLTYAIPASGQWRSGDDPELVRKAVVRLKSAIRYDYTNSLFKSYMTWLVLALLLLPLLVFIRKQQTQRKANSL